MKISQKQAALLAKEIVNQLKQKGANKVSDTLKVQLREFIEKRRVLFNEKAEIEEKINRHDMSLYKMTGKINRLYGGDSLADMCKKIEEKNLPNVGEIEDEIILKSMFKTDGDLDSFIHTIVSKYEKKLQSKIVQN